MSAAAIFSALGYYARQRFLEPETCAQIRDGVRSSPASPAMVRIDAESYGVDRATRRTDWVDIPAEVEDLVRERLAEVMPEVARHYDVTLTGMQSLQFLVYREGDFFTAHRDNDRAEDARQFAAERKIAAVVFLNSEGDGEDETFRGGALTLYGLYDDAGESVGFPLHAEEGLLITFPADTVHEVRPVEAGERFTAVTWFV